MEYSDDCSTLFLPLPPPPPPPPPSATNWTWSEHQIFEQALSTNLHLLEEGRHADLWDAIAQCIPGKTPDDVRYHHKMLMDDFYAMEAGILPRPAHKDDHCNIGNRCQVESKRGRKPPGLPPIPKAEEKSRGTNWTETEHRLFLRGLDKYGRGHWRGISTNCVKTRTPTQVASHAQKYFERQKNKGTSKRKSIHDITEP